MGSEPPHQPLSARAGCVALWVHHAQRLLCTAHQPLEVARSLQRSLLSCPWCALRSDWLSVSINQRPSGLLTPEGLFYIHGLSRSLMNSTSSRPSRARPGFQGNATNSHIVANRLNARVENSVYGEPYYVSGLILSRPPASRD